MPIRPGFKNLSNSTSGSPPHNLVVVFEHDTAALSHVTLAAAVADHMMDNWFGGTPDCLAAWRAKLQGTPHTDPFIQQQLSDVVGSNLRLPTDPYLKIKKGKLKGQENLEHLEGAVGEHLWHMITAEGALSPQPEYQFDLGYRSHDKGPDGFIIVKQNGKLEFHLWEIKKNSTGGSSKSTVDGAAAQLDRRAPDYLQEIAAINRNHPDPALHPIFQNLPRHWAQRDPEANVGVAVVTSRPPRSSTPFADVGLTSLLRFPRHQAVQGVLMNTHDLRTLALAVRQVIWNGL